MAPRQASRFLQWSAVTVVVGIIVGYPAYKLLTAPTRAKQATHDELERQRQVAIQERIPLAAAEFIRPKVKTDSDNAAPLYKEASNLVESPAMQTAKKYVRPKELDNPAARADFRRYLKLAERAMALTATAAQRPVCDFGFDIAKSATTTFPWLAGIKYIAKVASYEAKIDALEGKPLAGLEVISRYAPMCGHLVQTPGLIHQLVATAISTILADKVNEILANHGREPGVAEAAQSVIAKLEYRSNFDQIIAGENLSQLTMLSPKFMSGPSNPMALPQETAEMSDRDRTEVRQMLQAEIARTKPGMLDRWRALQIEMTRALVKASRDPSNDYIDLERKFEGILLRYTVPEDDDHLMLKISFTGWRDMVDPYARALSQRRVLAQAAALFEVWNRTGNLPDNLPLPGPAARDPLTKGTLHYSKTTNGFKIYGIGAYGVDHGGKTRILGSTTGYDIVFTYPWK